MNVLIQTWCKYTLKITSYENIHPCYIKSSGLKSSYFFIWFVDVIERTFNEGEKTEKITTIKTLLQTINEKLFPFQQHFTLCYVSKIRLRQNTFKIEVRYIIYMYAFNIIFVNFI